MISDIELSHLALEAATDLDRRLRGSPQGVELRVFADALSGAFSAAKTRLRPALPAASLGLVCNVVEQYEPSSTKANYGDLADRAERIAQKLTSPELPTEELEKLIKFCVAFYYATKHQDEMEDVSASHPDLITLA